MTPQKSLRHHLTILFRPPVTWNIRLRVRRPAWVAWQCLALLVGFMARADRPASPFSIVPAMEKADGQTTVKLRFHVPEDHVLYADRLKFLNDEGEPIAQPILPAPVVTRDKSDGHEKKMYLAPFVAELKLPALPTNLIVRMQGCSNSACYFPEKRQFAITPGSITPVSDAEPAAASASPTGSDDCVKTAGHFAVAARQTGYVKSEEFLSFLKKAKSGDSAEDDPIAKFQRLGLATTLLLIVVGGIGLNLTPCVLPMIPINLAIIGAGARAGSRKRGFALGGIYGAGMALAYGSLGLVVVLTGAKFGTLNSSPWFNFAIAVVFVVLALGMFDIIPIDPSRFQNSLKRPGQGQAGQGIAAFTLGAFAALLAGACVAPVVISVILLAAHLYGKGVVIGLLLPFLLGLGMALPWPFAGAGLKFLPKPGSWMKWVKFGFGILILVFAGYYGRLGWSLSGSHGAQTNLADASSHGSTPISVDSNQALLAALQQAEKENRPVFVDFAASWCKNCVAMDETVFNQDQVKASLKDFIFIRYEAEKPNELPAKPVLDHFKVIGLPTYLVLKPGQPAASKVSSITDSKNSL